MQNHKSAMVVIQSFIQPLSRCLKTIPQNISNQKERSQINACFRSSQCRDTRLARSLAYEYIIHAS